MKLQRLLSYVRKACDEYQMIREGDKIAVGVSGGKDSLALLIALANLRRFYPKKFELCAITISLGFPGSRFDGIAELCGGLGVPFSLVETDIGEIVFDARKEKNPCSLCSKMRKGALNAEAGRLGCDSVALGHHKDDVCETLFLSLFYEGRIHTFSPVTFLDRRNLSCIRPLIFAPESDIISFAKSEGLSVLKNPCPADGETKRREMKAFLREQAALHHGLPEKIFGAIRRSDIQGWGK